MSRSRKKTPVGAWSTARSDKWFKKHTSRVTRHRNKVRLMQGKEMLKVRELSNLYFSPKDGKYWITRDLMARYPELMRK